MASSKRGMIGIMTIGGAILFLLLKEKAKAQVVPSTEIIPSVTPSISPEPSPAPSPTQSVLPVAPSSGGGTISDILTNPALRRIISETLKIPINEITDKLLTQGAAAVGLINLGISTQQNFTNPYSGIVQGVLNVFPVLGTAVGGFIEGILGSPLYGAGEEWIPESLNRGNVVVKVARDLIDELQSLADQEPYVSMLANATYNKEGWAIPSNWRGPTKEQYQKYYLRYSFSDISGVSDYGMWPEPTETIEDFTPWADLGVYSYSKDFPYPVDISPFKVGINLFSLLGFNPIFDEAYQAARNPEIYAGYFDLDGVAQLPTAVPRPETITLLGQIFGPGWMTWINGSQQAWALGNYGLPLAYSPYTGAMNVGLDVSVYINPWDYEFQYPWDNPYLKAAAAVPMGQVQQAVVEAGFLP
jgi:hypothetical protein